MRATAFAALAALALLAGCGGSRPAPATPARAKPASATLAAAGAPLDGRVLGVNGEAVSGAEGIWGDARFVHAVADLRPQALRVFGGTPANYWDWRAGTFVAGPRVPAALRSLRSQVHVTLADWARVVRAAGAIPLYDLNVLTSTLHEQLAMLHAARGLGLPVARVELGNELYLPRYRRAFPDGAAYGRLATRWIAGLKRAFPGVRVGIAALAGRDANSGALSRRERGWNATLLATERGADALSLHTYFSSGLRPGQAPAGARAIARMLAAPARRWLGVAPFVDRLPPGLETWLTEWNLFDRRARVHGTWAQALDVALYGLLALSDARVTQSLTHALVSSAPFGAIFADSHALDLGKRPARAAGFAFAAAHPPPTAAFGLSGTGLAMRALLRARTGAARAAGILFAPAGVKAAGLALLGGTRAGAVLLNLGSVPLSVRLPAPLAGLRYEQLWTRPARLVAGPDTPSRRRGRTGSELRLEPYSLSSLGGSTP